MELRASCNVREVRISTKDLPLCCPTPDQALWNAHPRIYLSLDQTGKAVCPYCGTHYHLQASDC